MIKIQAGCPQNLNDCASWVYIDLGFSRDKKTCGILVDRGEPEVVKFSELCQKIKYYLEGDQGDVNLVLEAPLSVSFTDAGNPVGRKVETTERGGKVLTRYWYTGTGPSVLLAAMYFLDSLRELKIPKTIRLFEGFVSYKESRVKSSHCDDVRALRDVVLKESDSNYCGGSFGEFIWEEDALCAKGNRIESAFRIKGFDFGVPPVIKVIGATKTHQ